MGWATASTVCFSRKTHSITRGGASNVFGRCQLDLRHAPELSQVDPGSLAGRFDLLRYQLRELVVEDFGAIHLFLHEEDDLLRTCIWCGVDQEPAAWREHLPIDSSTGFRFLMRLRSMVKWRRRDELGAQHGVLACRTAATPATKLLTVRSMHQWDMRIWVSDCGPLPLPYVLLNRDVAAELYGGQA